jgi:pyridoxine 4-dehydrogenase
MKVVGALTVFFMVYVPIGTLAFSSWKELSRNTRLSTVLYSNDNNNSNEMEGKEKDRREFLTNCMIAAAVGTGGLLLPNASEQAAFAAEASNVMSSKKLALPPMGLGAWAWGDSLFWGYDKKNDEELHKVYDYAVSSSSGPVLFDTAEIYGFGRSESLLGDFGQQNGASTDKVLIASKFAAFPFRTKAQDVVKACEASVQRLKRPIDLYQIHFPNAWSNAEYWDGLAMAYEKGLVKAVGVSNYGSEALRACHRVLAERGIPLTSNQIQLSLLYRWPLENGLMDTCRELDVDVLAYSPLALGFLTGKYDSLQNLPSGPRQALGKQLFEAQDFTNLITLMKEIASRHNGATVAQVALNWTRAKQSIPIPGARTLKQVQQNYAALDWTLTAEEIQLLDQASAKVTNFVQPDKSPFAKEDINTKMKMFDS